MVLTKVDFKVLHFAAINGVQMGEREIAKNLRLKPSTVSYALKKMRRERAILRYRYRLNYARLGLENIAWILVKLRFAELESFPSLDGLFKWPQAHVASFVTGEYDLVVKAVERDVFSIDQFVRQASKEYSKYFDDVSVLLVTKNYKIHNLVQIESACLPSLDETDFKILSLKMESPDASLGKVAKELGMHRNTVSSRWKKLWKENVLVKKTPVVNPGYYRNLKIALKALVLIDVSPEDSDLIAEKLVKMDEVHELNRAIGKYGLLAIVRTADVQSFFSFLKERLFKASPGKIKKAVSLISLYSKPHPPNYLPQLLEAGIVKFKKRKICCKQS